MEYASRRSEYRTHNPVAQAVAKTIIATYGHGFTRICLISADAVSRRGFDFEFWLLRRYIRDIQVMQKRAKV